MSCDLDLDLLFLVKLVGMSRCSLVPSPLFGQSAPTFVGAVLGHYYVAFC